MARQFDLMNEAEPSLLELARLHWRSLAPSWLAPALLMLCQVAEDVGGKEAPSLLPPVVMVLFVGSGLPALRLKHRVRIPTSTFNVLWLLPMMVVWCGLVFVRAVVMIVLGRSL